MVAELEQQRQARRTFLAGVAHDLRNPISALSLSVALIDPNEPLPPQPRIRRTIELVRRQLEKLERMVSDFMDMTRVEAGQLELHIERHDVAVLVRDVVHLFEATEPEQRIELSLLGEPVLADCDALRFFVVRRRVTAHSGRIELWSAPGAGACFSVYLPLRRASSPATPAAAT